MDSTTVTCDVAVVGAGMAGLCCAAELARLGAQVVLVAETPEVGWNIRTKTVEKNVGWMQHPVWNAAWGGGWWFQLVRALDISVQFEFTPPINLILHGGGGPTKRSRLSYNTSASGIVDIIQAMSPFPIDSLRDELVSILQDGLALDYRELQALADTPLIKWLDERGASVEAKALLAALSGAWLFTTPEAGANDISVFGLFGAIRIMQCAETPVVTIYPDPWRGLAIPIAKKVEALGHTIFRGTAVAEITPTGSAEPRVVLEDGRVIGAKAVAVATGTRRVSHFLPFMPDSVRSAVEYAAHTQLHEMDIFAVLGKPVITVDSYTMVMDYGLKFVLYISPLHALGPWSTQPGKQFIVAESIMPPSDVEALGGPAGVLQRLDTVLEELFPGYADALEAREVLVHRHTWQASMTHGPKLPRRNQELPGIWFVGDGTSPILSIGIENAAGAGILGARDIVADLGL